MIFYQSPEVKIASNTFIEVPIILQYEDTPLIEVLKSIKAGYKISIPIYHQDGSYLAKVVGSRLFLTEVGKKANLVIKHPKNMMICELDGKPLFELRRVGATAWTAQAELYTPEGAFVKCYNDLIPKLFIGEIENRLLYTGGFSFMGNVLKGVRIGIWIKKDGSLYLGVS